MKPELSQTIIGGLITIFIIAWAVFGNIVFWVAAALFCLGLSFALGVYSMISPVVKKPGTHIYWDGQRVKIESMLKLNTGLRDSSNSLIQPGEIYIMNIDGQFDKLTSFPKRRIQKDA